MSKVEKVARKLGLSARVLFIGIGSVFLLCSAVMLVHDLIAKSQIDKIEQCIRAQAENQKKENARKIEAHRKQLIEKGVNPEKLLDLFLSHTKLSEQETNDAFELLPTMTIVDHFIPKDEYQNAIPVPNCQGSVVHYRYGETRFESSSWHAWGSRNDPYDNPSILACFGIGSLVVALLIFGFEKWVAWLAKD
jgi:hypothetical protein